MAAPLTDLLKKEGFKWSIVAEKAFYDLNEAITNPPVLTLPNFSIPFEVEWDASGKAVGAILMQNGHPIAFFSQALKGRSLSMSTYENELFALVSLVPK